MRSIPENPALPPLRRDIFFLPGPILDDGSPSWTIHDPLRHLFFRIGWLEFEILSRWAKETGRSVTPAHLSEEVNTNTVLSVSPADVLALLRFLVQNCLVVPATPDIRLAMEKKSHQSLSLFPTIVKNYLFFRIPLFRPDRFLEATLPLARFLVRPAAKLLFSVLCVAALYLLARQWDIFRETFMWYFSPEGLVLFALAFAAAKIVHELGHAYAAKHYGLRVPTMGVAFLVFWPLLYTDVSEAWKLPGSRKRFLISASGGLAELAMAAMAALAWNFLPDGPLRSACFLVAAVTWIHSLLINLNPLVRFDGYHMLADSLGIPNLQARSFLLVRHFIRRLLFGMDEPSPEEFPPRTRWFLLFYGCAAWCYRLLLLAAIALAVYHFFFKALGLLLLGAGIVFSFLPPMVREGKYIWRHRSQVGAIRWNLAVSLSLFLLLAMFLVIPVKRGVTIPAVMKSDAIQKIFPPMAALLEEILVSNGDAAREGDVLFVLAIPAGPLLEKKEQARLRGYEMLLSRQLPGSDLFEPRQVLLRRMAAVAEELEGLRRMKEKLVIRAPFGGEILDMPGHLRTGMPVSGAEHLALLVDRNTTVVEGFVGEEDLAAIQSGSRALFYLEASPLHPVSCVVVEADHGNSTFLNEPLLASMHGGPLPVRQRGDALLNLQSLYRVRLKTAEGTPAPMRIERGVAVIDGERQSLIGRLWRRILSIVIRESGF